MTRLPLFKRLGDDNTAPHQVHLAVGMSDTIQVSYTTLRSLADSIEAALKPGSAGFATHLTTCSGDAITQKEQKNLLDHWHKGRAHRLSDNEGRGLLHVAAERGHAALIQPLVQMGADIEADDHNANAPLHTAASFGHAAVVDALADAGAKLEVLDVGDRTPMMRACLSGRFDAAQHLLKWGSNPNASDRFDKTPLHYALRNVQDDGEMVLSNRLVELLLASGADVNARDVHLRTPLHRAAACHSIAVLHRLLDAGADLEAADSNGNTPLFYTAKNARFEHSVLLITRGGNTESANQRGQTVVQYAQNNQQLEWCAAFRSLQDGRNALDAIQKAIDDALNSPCPGARP